MGSNVSMPAAPAAPAPIDPGQSSLDYIKAMADPALQQQLLESEQTYRPEYNKLELADINQLMYGSEGQQGYMGLAADAARQSGALDAEMLSKQRAADIGDVEALGGRASAAFMNANPALRAALERAQGLGASQTGGAVQQGALGQQLYSNALGAGGLGAAGTTLDQRAQQLAQSTGQLSPDEMRKLQQSSRAAFSARGMDMSNASIGAEAFSRLANERLRMQEDLAMAAQLNQGSQAELGANRQFQMGVQGADIARQGGNMQLQSQMLGQDRNYALALAQAQQSVASDPFQAILGRPSQAQATGNAQAQFASGLAQQQVGPNLFDPNAGINLGLQQNANLANYSANIYGAQSSYAGATNQARGAMIGGALSGLGALGGGFLAGCWVAREVYGVEDVRWLIFREWMLNESPKWFRHLYLTHGEKFALWIANKPVLKSMIRGLMNIVVTPRLKLENA